MANATSPVIQINEGNVGIGTTSPSQTLHIVGGNSDQLLVENGTSSGSARIQFKANSNRNAGPFIMAVQRGNSASDSDLELGDESGTILTLNGGNVGIGTISPDEVLEVKGIIKSENTGYTNTGIIINQTSHSDAWRLMQFGGGAFSLNLNGYTSGESRFQVDTSGNVSIPTGTLTVSGTGNSSIAGNVGIGTASPTDTLDVDGGIRLSTSGRIQGRSYPYTTNIGSGANATTTNITAGSTDKSEISLVGGDVGDRIEFKTNSTERMRIDASGNVGIGTTSPAEKLEVNGSIKVGPIKIQNSSGGE